jgi:hypothetical protein
MILCQILLLILFSFLGGYCLGRKNGRKEGLKEADILYPIKMREELFESGFCPICKNNIDVHQAV